jgi:molecular chaperone GrpE
MTNKRHPRTGHPHPPTPSLDPDTHEPIESVEDAVAADASAAPSTPDQSDGAAPDVEVWKERHLRLAAEYDNFRKRTLKERTEAWMRAQADLVSRLADVLDDLSRFAHVNPNEIDAKRLQEGVEMVERKIWKELEAAGVTRIDQAGVPFDPNVHEAVTMQPAADPKQDHTVGQVVQPGYKMGDKLLRPARVIVLTWQDR